MNCKYKRFTLSIELDCQYYLVTIGSNVNVFVYQGKSLLSLFILLRLTIFIQRIYSRSSLAALRTGPDPDVEKNIARKVAGSLEGILALL